MVDVDDTYNAVTMRVYSEENPKLNLKLEFERSMDPFIQQNSGFDMDSSFLFKWHRPVFAGDRLDEFERLLQLKGRDVFADRIVKLTDNKNRRAMFFKVKLDTPLSSTVMVDKIRRYQEKPPYDLYLFEVVLGFKNMMMLDLNIMDMDKLTPEFSAQLLA